MRVQTPDQLLPKVFGELRERYENRPGGYTRVLRTEPMNKFQQDQADSALLLFVDGPADVRFAMTAATVARDEVLGKQRSHDITLLNVKKVTAFRKNGMQEFREMVEKIKRSRRSVFLEQERAQKGKWTFTPLEDGS